MPTKMRLEWQTGPECYVHVDLTQYYSRAGNYYVKYNGQIYVFKDCKHGEKVTTKQDGKWREVGRITHGTIYLGEGKSEYELMQSPEGKAYTDRLFQNVVNMTRWKR